MSLGALNDTPATRATVSVPAWGAWWLDVELAEPVDLSGLVTFTLADKTFEGSIVSGGASHGRASYRIVGGRGGWGKLLPKKGYSDDAGVKLTKVIGDAAHLAGEAIEGAPTSRTGPHWARIADRPASAVLHELTPEAWRVDFDGVTRFGALPTVAYSGDGARTRVDPAGEIVEIATETIGELLPGVTVDGSSPATDVEYILSASRFTVRVYAGQAGKARRAKAMAQIQDALDPRARYRTTYEYRVVQQVGKRYNLQPARVASRMPDLENVPVRPFFGLDATVVPGSLCLVVFADGDPSRPQVIAGDAIDAPGWMPLTLELGGPGALGVARQTDAVIAGPFGGTIVGGSVRIKAVL